MGAGQLELTGPVKGMKMSQACAAIGQPLLMQEYRKSFLRHGVREIKDVRSIMRDGNTEVYEW